MTKQKGFTLIELMVAVMIVAILAAIAIPNYQRYIVKNAEEEVKAQIGQLELQLQRWRASALTYKGFVPANSSSTYGYASNQGLSSSVAANTIIYLPIGSDRTNYRYMIELVDIESQSGGSRSLMPTASNGSDATLGRGWKLVAYPNSSLASKDARRFLATSSGLRCAVVNSRGSQMSLGTTSCTNLETW